MGYRNTIVTYARRRQLKTYTFYGGQHRWDGLGISFFRRLLLQKEAQRPEPPTHNPWSSLVLELVVVVVVVAAAAVVAAVAQLRSRPQL